MIARLLGCALVFLFIAGCESEPTRPSDEPPIYLFEVTPDPACAAVLPSPLPPNVRHIPLEFTDSGGGRLLFRWSCCGPRTPLTFTVNLAQRDGVVVEGQIIGGYWNAMQGMQLGIRPLTGFFDPAQVRGTVTGTSIEGQFSGSLTLWRDGTSSTSCSAAQHSFVLKRIKRFTSRD